MFICKKDFQQEDGHSSVLYQKRSGILLTSIDHEKNGTESLNWWWSNSEKADTQFSVARVHCPEERSEAKEVENYQYTSMPLRDTIETVSRTKISVNQFSTCGAVSDLCDEYRTCQARTETPVLAGQSDPFRASKFVDDNTCTFDPSSFSRRSIAEAQRTSGKAFTTRSSDKDVYWCRIPDNSWGRTVLHDKRHWRIFTIHRFSGLSWVHFAKRWKIIWPERLDSREYQNWTRAGSHNQLPAR